MKEALSAVASAVLTPRQHAWFVRESKRRSVEAMTWEVVCELNAIYLHGKLDRRKAESYYASLGISFARMYALKQRSTYFELKDGYVQ